MDGQSPSNLAFKLTSWLADNELWLLALAAPLLLFPRGITPWLGLLIAALAWAARWLAFGRPSRSTPLDTPVVLLILCTLMGVAISIVPAWSASRAWSLVLGWLVYYAFVNWVRTERRANIAIGLALLLTLGVTMLSLIGTDWSRVRLLELPWLYQHLPTLLRGLPGSGVQAAAELFNPRWVGITLGFLLPIPAALALFSRRSKLRLASAVVFVLGGLVLLLSQSIQGLVGLAVGMLFVLIWRWRWFWVVIPLGLVGLGIAVAWYGPLRMANSLLSLQNPLGAAVALRLDIWSRGLAMLHDMPFSGIGLNAFQIIQADSVSGVCHRFRTTCPQPVPANCTGFRSAWIVGVCVAAGRLVPGCLAQLPPHGDAEQRLWLVGLAAAVISYLAHGFLDAMMLGAKPGVALWFILALGVAIPVGEQPVQERAVTLARKGLRWLPLALLVVSLVLLAFLQPAALPMNCGAVAAQHVLVDFEMARRPRCHYSNGRSAAWTWRFAWMRSVSMHMSCSDA